MRRLKIYFTVYFDSSPSCDDSHGAVDDMPKEKGSSLHILSASSPF